jgi:hypothetical protein
MSSHSVTEPHTSFRVSRTNYYVTPEGVKPRKGREPALDWFPSVSPYSTALPYHPERGIQSFHFADRDPLHYGKDSRRVRDGRI